MYSRTVLANKFLFQIEEHKKRRKEALVTVDAYRIAFEEQLTRNRGLMKRLAEVTTLYNSPTNSAKAKAALKWLIKQLNEGMV